MNSHFIINQIISEPIVEEIEKGITTTRRAKSLGWLVQSCSVFKPGPFEYTKDGFKISLTEPIFDEEARKKCKKIAEEKEFYNSNFYHSRFYATKTITLDE